MFDLRLWLESLLDPIALLTWGLLGLLILAWRTKVQRWVRLGAGAVLVFDVLVSTPLLVNPAMGAMQAWARRDMHCGPPPPGSVIIVLTGGMVRQPSGPDDVAALSGDSLRRILGGVALAQQTPGSMLVITGSGETRNSEPAIMGRFAEVMGIAARRIVLEEHSHTTLQNALRTRNLPVGDLQAPRYLVTSAYHMPRAYRAFRDVGQKVCAWPVVFLDTRVWYPDAITPQINALSKTTLLWHEWLGIAFYRIRHLF